MDINVGIRKSQIITDNKDIIKALYKYYAYYVPGYRYVSAYKRRQWDGKKHFVSLDGIFRTGLLDRILEDLKRIEVQEINLSCFEDLGDIDLSNFSLQQFSDMTYRWYQENFIIEAIRKKRGIVDSPTGSGKTLIMAGLIKNLLSLFGEQDKILCIFPNKQLTKQTWEFTVKDSNLKHCGIATGEGYLPSNIMMSTVQSLHKFVDRFEDCKCVMFDEVHEFTSKQRQKVLEAFPQATHRYGFTGTVPTDKLSAMILESNLGPPIKGAGTRELIDEDSLTEPIIEFFEMPPPDPEDDDLLYEELYEKYIITNDFRNNRIREICTQATGVKHSRTLIIVKNLKHLKILNELIPGSLTLQGSDDLQTRYKVIDQFTKSPYPTVLIGTRILQTGVNIEEITHMINARGQAKDIPTLQALGRIMRKHKSKDVAYMYDFMDKAKYLFGHSKKRKKHYMRQGHKVICK